MIDLSSLFDKHLFFDERLTYQTVLCHDDKSSYIVKEVGQIEYTNYLKIKDDNIPILKPIAIAKEGINHYFLYRYYQNYDNIYDLYEKLLRTINIIHSKTNRLVPIPKMSEFKYKKIAVIANDKFNLLEMKIRQIELEPVKNDISWIYLSKYHIVLDVKLEIYKMIKRLKTINDDIYVGINHGFPSITHFFNDQLASYKYIKEGAIENDIYKIYLDFDGLDINHFDIIDKYLKYKYSKKYFKLMVLFTYVLMIDIELNYITASKYITITNKMIRFLNQFKTYK